MMQHRIFSMAFAKIHALYVQKAERKGRTRDEVDRIIGWLTGYDPAALQRQIELGTDFQTFFDQAPAIHPNSSLIRAWFAAFEWKTSKIRSCRRFAIWTS